MTLSFQSHIPKADENRIFQYCYKHFNIFLRSEKSDLAMVRTGKFLEDCFSQYEVIQTDSLDSSNIEIFCFHQLLEYVPFYLCFSWGDCKREEQDLM
jgi:hypothetical protein